MHACLFGACVCTACCGGYRRDDAVPGIACQRCSLHLFGVASESFEVLER